MIFSISFLSWGEVYIVLFLFFFCMRSDYEINKDNSSK